MGEEKEIEDELNDTLKLTCPLATECYLFAELNYCSNGNYRRCEIWECNEETDEDEEEEIVAGVTDG
jgi:hypothetical protein